MAGRRPRCAGYDERRPPRSAAPPVEVGWSSGAAVSTARATTGWPTSPGRSSSIRALADDDLVGSIAHVNGLARADLLTADEAAALIAGLEGLRSEVAAGTITWDPALEDVHLNLEAALAERIGPLAGQAPHRPLAQRPGRDRPAPVGPPGGARPGSIRSSAMERSLVGLAERDGDAILPGYDPHPAGPAGPVRPPPAGLRRDARARSGSPGRCPPAAQRLARSGRARWPVRAIRSTATATAAELGFEGASRNSLDAVSDRDFVVEILAAVALGDGPPEPAGGGADLVVESALRVRPAGRIRSRPAAR